MIAPPVAMPGQGDSRRGTGPLPDAQTHRARPGNHQSGGFSGHPASDRSAAGQPGGSPDAPAMDSDQQLQILRELTQALAEKPDINEVCQLVIEGIHRAIGMQRVALLMTDRLANYWYRAREVAAAPKSGASTLSLRKVSAVNASAGGRARHSLPALPAGLPAPGRYRFARLLPAAARTGY